MVNGAHSLLRVCRLTARALFPIDASQGNIIWSFSKKLTVPNAVGRGLPSYLFGVFFLLRQGSLKQVRLEFFGPAPLPRLEHKGQAHS